MPRYDQWANVPVSTVITTTSTQIFALACNLEYVPKHLNVVRGKGAFVTARPVSLN